MKLRRILASVPRKRQCARKARPEDLDQPQGEEEGRKRLLQSTLTRKGSKEEKPERETALLYEKLRGRVAAGSESGEKGKSWGERGRDGDQKASSKRRVAERTGRGLLFKVKKDLP